MEKSKSKLMLVLLDGGYSTRLGFAKHSIRTSSESFLFESLLRAIPASSLTIITNKTNIFFWHKWNIERSSKFGLAVNILVESHEKPEQAFGPIRYLTTTLPIMFSRDVEDVVVCPIDSYYKSFSFVPKFLKQKQAFVVAKYPINLIKQMGVVKLNWRDQLQSFEEKPSSLEDSKFLESYYVFTGMFKTTLNTLLQVGQIRGVPNLGSIIKNLSEKDKNLKVIKCNTEFRDVGIMETFKELLDKGVLVENVN